MMQQYDLNNIKNAYRKLKSYIYYDNFFVYLREKIAFYESSHDFETNLELLVVYLNDPEENKEYLDKLLSKIDTYIVPKKYKKYNDDTDFIISNDFIQDSYEVEKINFLIDAPIEIHILSVLWILEEGYTLTKDYIKNNYAYCLEIDPNTNRVVDGLRLFKPYFEQYQKWRDNAINNAQQFLNDETDILIIGLDVKEYFYNIRLDEKKQKSILETIQDRKPKNYNSVFLTQLIFIINETYASKLPVGKKENSIPIGLLSSGVLSNWYLKDFDFEIIDNLSPAYYGRYVDDIVIVLSNAKVPKKHLNNEDDSPINRTLKKFFVDRGILHQVPDNSNENRKDLKYEWKKNPLITIQKSKISIHSFNSKESKAILEKFKKNIRKNSSAFWLLPNENQINDDFDESVYELAYTDTINKLRSISEIKQSKYGASIFLAKKIKISLLSDNEKDEKTTEQILTFFKGRMNLEFISIWEKVLTYFLITNDHNSFSIFIRETTRCIDKISYEDKFIEAQIKKSQLIFLINSVSIAVSLNPSFLNNYLRERFSSIKFDWFDSEIYSDVKKRILWYRKTNLFRHSYVLQPLLNFISFSDNDKIDFLNYRLEKYIDVNLDNRKLEYAPRYVYFYEFSHFYSFHQIINLSNKIKDSSNGNVVLIDNIFLIKEEDYSENFILNKAFECFYDTNYYFRNPQKYKDEDEKRNKLNVLRNSYFNNAKEHNRSEKIIYDFLEVSKNKLKENVKVAVANILVEKENIEKSFKNMPNTSKDRRREFLSILNDAERNKADFLILPELSVPHRWFPLLADEARRKDRVLIAGLEHITINNICFNFTVTLLPLNNGGIKDAVLVLRLKNHYSPHEEKIIKDKGKIVPKPIPATYNKFVWNKIHFSVYNCYELADITHRTIFRSEVDILFASEYNRDINYFSNIVDTVARDVHCYFVQANSSDYGDSRITKPSRTETKDILRLKGGTNNVILCGDIDLKSLREFQSTRVSGQIPIKFKNTPPDFDHSKAEKRLLGK